MSEQYVRLRATLPSRDALTTAGYWLAWSLLLVQYLISDSLAFRDALWLVPIALWMTAYKVKPLHTLDGVTELVAAGLATTTFVWVLIEGYFGLLDVAQAFTLMDEHQVTRIISIPLLAIVAAVITTAFYSPLCVRTLGMFRSCALSAFLLVGSIFFYSETLFSNEHWQTRMLSSVLTLIYATVPSTIFFIGCCIAHRYSGRVSATMRMMAPRALYGFWRGESFRWLTTLTYCLAVFAVMRMVGWRINLPNQDLEPLSEDIALIVSWGSILITLYLASVPAWRRCCNNGGPFKRLAKFGIALVSLPFIVLAIFVEGPRIGMLIGPLAQYTIGTPWRIMGTDDPQELSISGDIGYGFGEHLKDTLSKHPEVTRLILSSDGGLLREGAESADLIRDKALTTVVTDRCSSACTLLFAAGKDRILRSGGQLGFHAGYGGNDYLQKGLAKVYIALGIDPEFVTRAVTVPPKDMWYPTPDELLAARVITQREK